MGHERWFRGQQDGQERSFDWLALAEQHGIPEPFARALYEQALSQAHEYHPSAGRAQEIYLALLADAREDTSRPSPGKITRTMRVAAERAGMHGPATRAAPGKVTRTSRLALPGRHPRNHARDLHDQRAHLDDMVDVFRRFDLPLPPALESAWTEAQQSEPAQAADAAERRLYALPPLDAEQELAAPPLPAATRRDPALTKVAHGFTARSQRRFDSDAGTAVQQMLDGTGAQLHTSHIDLLAICFADGLPLTRWSLGSDRAVAATRVAKLVAHARVHYPEGATAIGTMPWSLPEQFVPTTAAVRPGQSQPATERLDDRTRRAVESTTGIMLGDVQVQRDAVLSAAGRVAEAVGNLIRLSSEVPGPEEPLGRKIRLHEAVHIAQQKVPDGHTTANRTRAVETEAHVAAAAAERGKTHPLGVHAEPSHTYGFGVSDIADALGVDPLTFIRERFPGLASLLSSGFEPLMQQIGDAAGRTVRSLLDGVGMDQLAASLRSMLPGEDSLTFGLLTGCCECLDHALQGTLHSVQQMLQGDTAQTIQQWFAQLQEDGNHGIIDNLANLFDFLHETGGPIVQWLEELMQWVDQVGDTIWQWIAPRLGLDPSLPPRQAIRKKLDELWAQAMEALEPVRLYFSELWDEIKSNEVIAKILKVAEDCQKLIRAIELCRESRSRDPQRWLAILARELRGTIFEDLVTSLQGGWNSVLDLKDSAIRWFTGVLDKLGLLAAWNAAVPHLRVIGQAINSFAQRVQHTLGQLRQEIEQALSKVIDALQELYEGIKPYLDFVVGLGVALVYFFSGNPLPLLGFLAGQLWLNLPDCYKEPIANFILDLMIEIVQFVPALHPAVVVIRAAALGCLRQLRGASAAQKITAMDTIARCIAGDIEFYAGFLVGLLEGLWESSLGLVVRMAIMPLTSTLGEIADLARSAAEFAGQAFETLVHSAQWLVDFMANAQTTDQDQLAKDMGAGQRSTGEEESADNMSAAAEPEILEEAPEEDADIESSGGGASSSGSTGNTTSSQTDDGPSDGHDTGHSGDEDTSDAGPAPEVGGFEPPPAFPGLGDISAIIDRVFRRGVTREEIEQFFKNFNLGMERLGTETGERAAGEIITFLTSRAAAYQIGEVVGKIVGFAAGEIIMLIITEGIGNALAQGGARAVQVGEIVSNLTRNFPRAIELLNQLKTWLRPLLGLVERLGDDIMRAARALRQWIDRLIVWAERQLVRLMNWAQRNFPRLTRWLRRAVRRLAGDDIDEELEEIAEAAAEQAWDKLESQLGGAVHGWSRMRSVLAGIGVRHPASVSVNLEISTWRSTWKVKATARKGSKRETAKHGAGWITTRDGTRERFYALANYRRLHNNIIDDAIEHLLRASDRASGASGRDAGSVRQVYDRKVEQMRREQDQGQRRIRLRDVTFSITPEDFRGVERDREIRTEFLISPNAQKRVAHVPVRQHDQHPSSFVETRPDATFILKREFQGKEPIRDTFYGRKKWRREVKRRKRVLLQNDTNHGGLLDPADPGRKWKWRGQSYSLTGDEKPSWDHTPPVADHWNGIGHDCRQPDRLDFFNDLRNLELVPLRINSSNGSGGSRYRPDVTINFRGRGENNLD